LRVVEILEFEGKLDPDEFLEWLHSALLQMSFQEEILISLFPAFVLVMLLSSCVNFQEGMPPCNCKQCLLSLIFFVWFESHGIASMVR